MSHQQIVLNISKKCNICNNFSNFGNYYNCPNLKWKCYTCNIANDVNYDHSQNNYCKFCSKIIPTGTGFLLDNNTPIHISCKKRYDKGVVYMENKDLHNFVIPLNKATNVWKNDDNLNCHSRCNCCLKIIHYENSRVWQIYNENSFQGLIYYIDNQGSKYVYKQDTNINICYDCYKEIKFKDYSIQLTEWEIDGIIEPIHNVFDNREINPPIIINESPYISQSYSIQGNDENNQYFDNNLAFTNDLNKNYEINQQYLNFDIKKDSKLITNISGLDKSLCCVCQDNVPNIIMVPCGHLCICKICLVKSENKSIPINNCPICRKKASKMQVYLS